MRFCLSAEFPATHRIRIDRRGTLEPLHAHNWRVHAWLDGDEQTLPRARRVLAAWVDRHRGNCFNDVSPFDRVNPTAEEVARVVTDLLADSVREARVVSVEVGEAAGFSATCLPD